jgi:hypothetical protein
MGITINLRLIWDKKKAHLYALGESLGKTYPLLGRILIVKF